ncbi:hypothetical protein F2S72_09055 [Pseudomonas syringae pv. actinidiae]|nr:hypothetical protein [Pseudomonas syringae pv. actinidiae]
MTSTAFAITADDVESVLHDHTRRIINSRGLSIDALAAEVFGEIDEARVEKAALNTSTNFDEQVSGAYSEIKDILVEIGVLEF